MSNINIQSPTVTTKVDVRQRRNVLYQITYEILNLFHARNMSTVGKTLYAGLIDMQAINRVSLTYYGKNRDVEFYIDIDYDWDTYEVLISSSRKDICVDSKLSTIDQFIGKKVAFKELYKLILSTRSLYSRDVTYNINPEKEKELEQILGCKFSPAKKREINRDEFKSYDYYSDELEELQFLLNIKKTEKRSNVYFLIKNKLKGF